VFTLPLILVLGMVLALVLGLGLVLVLFLDMLITRTIGGVKSLGVDDGKPDFEEIKSGELKGGIGGGYV
jgi:hypothetical protein